MDLLTPQQAFKVTLGPAPCALDIGDGSERGEYVDQDYLLRLLGRPHRGVNLMYCYYPLDKGWPLRASIAHKPTAGFAWAYPYDDYFPYEGGPGGNRNGRPFNEIRDIRRHGQDVTLTLTIDCAVDDKHLRTIARELAPFGYLRLRINHECDGNWFAHNKRYTHRQISDFFVRFHNIINEEAPLVRTICCWGTVDWGTGQIRHFDDLSPMLKHADIWSLDRYASLHYGWPFNICEEGQLNKAYTEPGIDKVWKEMHTVYDAFADHTGQAKPFEICEFNCDGDIPGGVARQRRDLHVFYRRILKAKPRFLTGITYYQFRDRGRLGLEREDPNNPNIGIPMPFLADYRKLIQDPHFSPVEKWKKLPKGSDLATQWRHSEDSDGVGYRIKLAGKPTFFELKLPSDANLLIRAGQHWQYKKPGYEWVDATCATTASKKGDEITVALFAPPADGGLGGNYAFPAAPQFRIRY